MLANLCGSISWMIGLVFISFYYFLSSWQILLYTKIKWVQSDCDVKYQKLYNQFFTIMGIAHRVSIVDSRLEGGWIGRNWNLQI
jgi:hypothetical protein